MAHALLDHSRTQSSVRNTKNTITTLSRIGSLGLILLGEEELLIKKFKMLANHAEDEEIKDKFEQISERHQKHFDSLYKQLG